MRGDGLVGELFARFGVLQSRVVAGHGGADGSPADAVARLIEAAERAAESRDAREQIFFRDFAVGEGEAAGDGCAQGPFAVNIPRLETGRTFFDKEAANFFVFAFGPDDGDVRDGAAGDPHFFAVKDVLVALFHGAGKHAAWV